MNIRFVSLEYVHENKDKKTKRKQLHMSGINNKNFREDEVMDKHHMPYKKITVKNKDLIIKRSDIGKRVYWSGDTLNKYYELVDIKMPDEIGFADGAYTISKDSSNRFPIHCYTDEVILHPDNFKQKRKRKNRRKK